MPTVKYIQRASPLEMGDAKTLIKAGTLTTNSGPTVNEKTKDAQKHLLSHGHGGAGCGGGDPPPLAQAPYAMRRSSMKLML
jgi:hypothetical protein